jgi:hypothetical protein
MADQQIIEAVKGVSEKVESVNFNLGNTYNTPLIVLRSHNDVAI